MKVYQYSLSGSDKSAFGLIEAGSSCLLPEEGTTVEYSLSYNRPVNPGPNENSDIIAVIAEYISEVKNLTV